jgi:hypothetical protein
MAITEFDLDAVIPLLDHRRTRIVYDSTYPVVSMLFYHIIPHYISSKRIFIAVYSDTSCRRLNAAYNSVIGESPEIADILEKVNIIKIGMKEKAPFGKLYAFIPEGELGNEVDCFENVAKTLTDDDLIILSGFYLMPAIHGREKLKNIVRMFDSFPEKNHPFWTVHPWIVRRQDKQSYRKALRRNSKD